MYIDSRILTKILIVSIELTIKKRIKIHKLEFINTI